MSLLEGIGNLVIKPAKWIGELSRKDSFSSKDVIIVCSIFAVAFSFLLTLVFMPTLFKDAEEVEQEAIEEQAEAVKIHTQNVIVQSSSYEEAAAKIFLHFLDEDLANLAVFLKEGRISVLYEYSDLTLFGAEINNDKQITLLHKEDPDVVEKYLKQIDYAGVDNDDLEKLTWLFEHFGGDFNIHYLHSTDSTHIYCDFSLDDRDIEIDHMDFDEDWIDNLTTIYKKIK